MTTEISRAELTALGYVERTEGHWEKVHDAGSGVEPDPAQPNDEDTSWQEMQRQCYRVFADAGCEVYWLSQSRRTRQTPGLPDLLVFGPPGEPFHLAWETKAGRGGPSEAQRKFALHCHRTGFPYRIGNARMARRVLHELRTHSND